MDATRDSDPNHYQICYAQAQKLHTSLVNSLQSFELTILSFNEFQQNPSEAVNTSIVSFLARYPDLKDFLIFGRFSSGITAMTISNLPDNTVYDQKIADIASRYGISSQIIEDLLRCRHELDSSVLQNKFDQICNGMANYIAINVNQDLTHVTEQIQRLIDLLQQQGKSPEEAQEKVAKDIATQAQNEPIAKEKLVKWGELIGTATVTEVVKGAVKLAIRLAGIPIP